jgi:hypothetical protein
MRFASLGAIGPDVFATMADRNADTQSMMNFLVKIAGTFQCISDVLGEVTEYVEGRLNEMTAGTVEQLQQTTSLLTGVLKEAFLAALVDAGVSLWPYFELPRQQDQPRERWYWMDYVHYVKTGDFARRLVDKTRSRPNLHAYALGYLTHCIADTLGHPYVNQITQSVYRLHWQRHHLIENFIDVYVWDRWHRRRSSRADEETRFDEVVTTPNSIGDGAPLNRARLHDHIAIGALHLPDPVDGVVREVARKIKEGSFRIDIAEDLDVPAPDDEGLREWAALLSETIQEVYGEPLRHPRRLAAGVLAPPRPRGYPEPEDVAAAYAVMRLFLKISTEDGIQEPTAPDISNEIMEAWGQWWEDFQEDLAKLAETQPPPSPPVRGGRFDYDAARRYAEQLAKWAAEVCAKVWRLVTDMLKDLAAAGVAVITAPIRMALYYASKILYAAYRYFRQTLVLHGYTAPMTEELEAVGDTPCVALWRTLADVPAASLPVGEHPEEDDWINNDYDPYIPPVSRPDATVEQPAAGSGSAQAPAYIAPYRAPTRPEDFLDAPRGPDDMFLENGPTFASARRFGGVMDNCRRALELASSGFPGLYDIRNYNLDGDRGYAWPCWDVDPAVRVDGVADMPLDPTRNGGTVRVAVAAL